MLDQERIQRLHWLLLLAWLTASILVIVGIRRAEGPLQDSNIIALMDYGFSKGYIRIVQRQPGDPLVVESFKTNASPEDFLNGSNSSVVFSEGQWKRVEKAVRQFVASANWGLGDPFLYDRKDDGSAYAKAFHAADFTYQNPFDKPLAEPLASTFTSSQLLGPEKRGWRVIGRNIILSLNDQAKADELTFKMDDESAHGATVAAKRFVLIAPDGTALKLSIGDSPVAEDKSKRVQVEILNTRGDSVYQEKSKGGEYFVWNNEPFAVFDSTASATQPLVFTKYINGRPIRVHTLGEATTNLIGATLGGYTPYLDGAVRASKVDSVALTLDPDLQVGSFFLLRNTLLKLDGVHYLGRPRRGSVAILDLKTGGILAEAGYPSFESDWTENRRVLVDRAAIARNPAHEIHMAGSTIKVMTVGMGYLLFGNAQAELLPKSVNSLAVRQAFQDVYGSELTAPLDGNKALVTPQARDQFKELGGTDKVRPDCLALLTQVFLVSPNKDQPEQREQIVGAEFSSFFDMTKLSSEFFPEQSRFPILNADSMERFRHYALGTEESRFTTLRLAATLGTVSTGHVLRPFIVESVRDKSNKLWKEQTSAFGDIDLHLNEIQFRKTKMVEIKHYLRKVLLPGGTGYFFRDNELQQYLAADNPSTTTINELQTRSQDYGKSGTADYGDPDIFQDSLFVYRHGQYAIAVWLEHADRGEISHSGHKAFERHPAHKLVDQIIRLIETYETPHN